MGKALPAFAYQGPGFSAGATIGRCNGIASAATGANPPAPKGNPKAGEGALGAPAAGRGLPYRDEGAATGSFILPAGVLAGEAFDAYGPSAPQGAFTAVTR